MPTRERVLAFIAMIERGEFLESIPAFYAETVMVQENSNSPRIGREAQLANEKQTLAHSSVESALAESYVIDGDRVAIHWVFVMKPRNSDRAVRLDEIAYQVWSDDVIVHERFFYDPTLRPVSVRKEA